MSFFGGISEIIDGFTMPKGKLDSRYCHTDFQTEDGKSSQATCKNEIITTLRNFTV
jgi:hypothetical protein